MKISLVIPVYNSENSLETLIHEIENAFDISGREYEIILVNDSSIDNSWQVILKLVQKHKHIIAVDLLKNYGQHNALMCGFHYMTGDYAVTLDDDLQNPPSEIEKLIQKAEQGYEVVFGKFEQKQHRKFRRWGTKLIGYINQKIFDKPKKLTLTNFRIIRKDVIERMKSYQTAFPYITGLILLFSDTMTNVVVKHKKRTFGKSNYNLFKIVKLVNTVLFNYSSFPIRFLSIIGFVISFLSFVLGLTYIIRDIFIGIDVKGWTTIVVLLSFFGGYIILLLGMLGEYVAKINKQISNKKSFTINTIVKSNGEK